MLCGKEEIKTADKVIEIVVEINDATGGKLGGIQSKLLAMDKAVQRMHSKLASLGYRAYTATISLIDRVTPQGSKINNLLRSLASKAYNISMKINDSALAKIRSIEASLMKIAGRAYTVAINVKDNVSGKLKGLTDGALMGMGTMGAGMLGTAGIGYGVVNAVQASMGFEKQMSRVQALRQLDKNSEDMRALTELAKELGMKTAWTREQVGQAMEYQALAGWETPQILKATPHMLNLASAGGMDLGAASDMLTDAMTAFGLNATDSFKNAAGKIIDMPEYFADMLAKVQASSNTDLYQLKEAIKFGAPTIGTMFANVEGQEGVQLRTEAARQMMIMAGLQANAGIKGSMAGTGINTIFNRLAGENRNTHFAERMLGLEHAENGNMLMPLDFIKGFQKRIREGMNVDEFTQIAEELAGEKIHADTRRKLNSTIDSALKNGGKLGSADIMKMSSMLAGLENMPKLLAMVFQDIDALEAKMNDVEGTAGGMANDMLDNLAGSFTKLGSAWDAFQQDLFTGTAGDGLRGLVDTMTEILTRANNLFKDGIQISDFGQIIADVVDRLKNKFLELDGVGSILAGGALMAGLSKIVSTAQKAIGYFRTLRGLEIGQRLGGATSSKGTGAISGATSVGTMNVTAGVVNVNGKLGGGSVGYGNNKGGINRSTTPPAILSPLERAEKASQKAQSKLAAEQKEIAKLQTRTDVALARAWANPGNAKYMQNYQTLQSKLATQEGAVERARLRALAAENKVIAQIRSQSMAESYYAKKEQLRAADAESKMRWSNMKSAAMGGAAFAAVFGALDVMNAKSMSEERTSSIATELEQARTAHQELIHSGAANDELYQSAAHIQQLESDQAQIIRENQQSEREALGGAAGSVIGAVIGAGLGSFLPGFGTMLGGIIGSIVGEHLGTNAAQMETSQPGEKPATNDYFGFNEPPAAETPSSWANFKESQEERTITPTPSSWSDFKQAENASMQELAERNKNRDEQIARFEKIDERLSKVGASPFKGDGGAAEYYQQQRAQLATTAKQTNAPEGLVKSWSDFKQKIGDLNLGEKIQQPLEAAAETVSAALMPSLFTTKLLGGGRAEAAELNESQLAQQAAMESGESPTPQWERSPESIAATEEAFNALSGDSILENLSTSLEGAFETLSTFGETIMETLSGSLEGVGEVFSGLRESISENLSSAFESASEIVSSFGDMLGEGLTSVLEGAGEMFSGFGELVSSALATAQGAAESALAAISAAFESCKAMIMGSWSELPGFFGGLFDGLGGIASAAGAAIYSGLTSVIGSIIGAWQSAASTISGIISSIASMASSAASSIGSISFGGGGGGAGFAEGGFVNSETHFFAGEHGPEVIIPLSSAKRSRALDLFEKTGAILGGESAIPTNDYATEDLPELGGGSVVPAIEGNAPAMTNNQTSTTTSVTMGGLNVTFNITGDKPQEIMETIKENLDELADRIMGAMSGMVDDCFNNQALEG